MKKYKVTVTRVTEYEVEVDENIYTEEARKDWERIFWDLEGDEPTEAFARGLAEQSIRLGVNDFIEGFSRVMEDSEQADRYKDHCNDINDNMFIREVDDYIESECEEVGWSVGHTREEV